MTDPRTRTPLPLLHGKDADIETLIMAIDGTYGDGSVPDGHLEAIVQAYDRTKTAFACFRLAMKGMVGIRWDERKNDVVLVSEDEAVERSREAIRKLHRSYAEAN